MEAKSESPWRHAWQQALLHRAPSGRLGRHREAQVRASRFNVARWIRKSCRTVGPCLLARLSEFPNRAAHSGLPGERDSGTRPPPGRLGRELRLQIGRHTSELQSLMRISYAVFCLKKKKSK